LAARATALGLRRAPAAVLALTDRPGVENEAACRVWSCDHVKTKLSNDTTVIWLVPSLDDFHRYMGIGADRVFGRETSEPVLPGLEGLADAARKERGFAEDVLGSLLQGLERGGYPKEFPEIVRELPRSALLFLLGEMRLWVEMEERPCTSLLLGGPDVLAVTAGRGSPPELVSRLPEGKYSHWIRMLADRNPYILDAAEGGRPYRALVHVVVAARVPGQVQPGLAIKPIPTMGQAFRGLLPAEFSGDLGDDG
jgi:hypothetical protein